MQFEIESEFKYFRFKTNSSLSLQYTHESNTNNAGDLLDELEDQAEKLIPNPDWILSSIKICKINKLNYDI